MFSVKELFIANPNSVLLLQVPWNLAYSWYYYRRQIRRFYAANCAQENNNQHAAMTTTFFVLANWGGREQLDKF